MRFISYYFTLSFCYLFMMTFAITGCSHEKNELAHDHAHEHEHGNHEGHEHEGHEGHNHGTGPEIVLETEMAEKMGVSTEHVSHGKLNDVIRVSGRVEPSVTGAGTAVSPTSGIFSFAQGLGPGSKVTKGTIIGFVKSTDVTGGDVNATARIALETAQKELERLTPLYEKKLVTAEKYNAARAAYLSAQAAFSPQAASGRVTAPCSGTITEIMAVQGEFVQTGSPIVRVSDSSDLILIAEVPTRYSSFVPTINDAVISTPAETLNLSSIGGKRISDYTGISNKPGYIPVVFTFSGENVSITTGSPVEVYLLGDERNGILTVPVSALTEYQGSYFVYIKIDDEGYLKTRVDTGASDGIRVEVISGLSEGDEVVVSGVTAVRLAETSGAVPEGHTHSH